MSAASPLLEDVFEQCCDMDASLAERLATFADVHKPDRTTHQSSTFSE